MPEAATAAGACAPDPGLDLRYRRELLERLRLPFEVARPDVDETAAARRSPGRAGATAWPTPRPSRWPRDTPGAWVIGSDQVAELDGRALGKPGSARAAIAQLRAMSGREVRFHTALCLARIARRPPRSPSASTPTHGALPRAVGDAEIERYVDAEQPLDCAGSFKCEGLGIALFDAHRQPATRPPWSACR